MHRRRMRSSHPPQLREDAPYRNVSAAGVAYLLATALARDGFDTGGGAGEEPTGLLDLAMIGLVGDVSSLSGVNRALVRDGLRRLRQDLRPGLRALCDCAGIDARTLTSTEIAFQVSPRLNAPGRLDDPRPAYELLVTRDRRQAERLAEQAEQANQRRKLLQERILREIDSELAANPSKLDRRVLVFAGSGWEPGIVGLAASKLADRYDRPVIVLTVTDGVAHGSARSVPGFDITSALSSAESLLMRHGGHERAAGLALEASNVADLDDAIAAGDCRLCGDSARAAAADDRRGPGAGAAQARRGPPHPEPRSVRRRESGADAARSAGADPGLHGRWDARSST